MKRILSTVLLGGVAACAMSAFAGDSSAYPQSTADADSTYRHLMAQCMDNEKQQDSAASAEDMKKICHAQVKAQMTQLRAQGQLPPASTSQSSPPSPRQP
jgi:hypothetical protein